MLLFICDRVMTQPSDNAQMQNAIDQTRAQPKSLTDLFVSFTLLALQGFGGVLAVVQRELVEKKRWMTREEFVEEWAVAQIMPGPNVVNLSLMIGSRYFGIKGAMAALAGMLAAPLVIVLLLALVYAQFAGNPGVQGALRGMGAVAAGLIAATGLKLFGALQKNVLGLPLCIALGVLCFIAIALLRWPLAYVLLGLGALACAVAYKRLAP
jgi:chromate transporter